LDHGEEQRFTLGILPEKSHPMSSREIVDMMLKRKKIELTASIIAKEQKNILGVLHPTEKRMIFHWLPTLTTVAVVRFLVLERDMAVQISTVHVDFALKLIKLRLFH
jgi:hypothetical protein